MNLQTIRRELHQIPELGFQEKKTHAYLLKKLKAMDSERLEIRTWETGILAKVKGNYPKKTIGYRCDIDGLPIKEETGYAFQSEHDGKMHACGHDFHMTIALGSVKSILDQPADDDVVFIFQPAEEGPGGAFPMMQSEVFDDWKPDVIFALHIAPELPVGTVSTRAGLLFANTSELFLDFKGKGGHAAYPHLTRDMTVAASSFVVELQQIVSRALDPLESAVVTIGKMESGFVQNAIAETARLEGTIRTLQPKAIDVVKEKLERLVRGFEISHECTIDIDYGSNYYQVYNDQHYTDLFKKTIGKTDLNYREAGPAMTGEDFGYMLKDIPGFMFWLGVDSPYGLHSSKLQPDERALLAGVKAVAATINSIAHQ
ncbi:N-acetyldiaminopimelate deacetylase [Virgibacillus siamensis]|uniref:N-acetyldiaminopimelate deacetylase n=1 Tax=Virgibacillus siamensis TaxID=480071 RepID=UPI0009867CA8|nr:N-acetyldiaminopimelate deacetylase [Virgibacillus siamensis]